MAGCVLGVRSQFQVAPVFHLEDDFPLRIVGRQRSRDLGGEQERDQGGPRDSRGITTWVTRGGGGTSSVTSFLGNSAVAFSPDGRSLAHAARDGSTIGRGSIRVFDVGSGRQRLDIRGHTGEVWSVAFSPDGKTLASGSEDSTIKLWDPPHRRSTPHPAQPHPARQHSAVFSRWCHAR